MPAQKAGLETGDQLVSMDNETIFSFAQLVTNLENKELGREVNLTVRKGGEGGLEKTYALTPVEKEILEAGVPNTRRLIGFRPQFKIVTTYPNPCLLYTSPSPRDS